MSKQGGAGVSPDSELSSAEPQSGERRRQYCFGSFTLNLDSTLLKRGDEEIALRPKSFEVLAYLIERQGRVVSREELMQAVWPDVAVTDESVTKCIADIRKAVGDESQQLIRTMARRGYLFTAPVMEFRQRLGEIPSAPKTESAKPAVQFTWIAMAAAAGLVIAAGVAAMLFRLAPGRVNAPAASEYTPLTNFTDAAFAPALSPDGRMLAFIRGEDLVTLGGAGEIYVKLLPDGEPVQLTHTGGNKMTPVFTPGGDRIAYGVPVTMSDPMGWSTWTVSVFGGKPTLLLSNASALTWIPRSYPPRVLFSEVDYGSHMSIVTAEENRTGSRTIYAPAQPNAMAHRSFLSPDRKNMLVVEMEDGWRPCRLVPFEHGTVDAAGEAGKPVGPSRGQCSSAAWSPDGKWMYFTVDTGNGYHIWRQRFPAGSPEQVTFGATEERDTVFAPDSRSFLTSIGTRQSTLWIHDTHGERQITSQGYASLPRFSPDGKSIYFLLRSRASRRYVSGELWRASVATDEREHLLPDFLLQDYNISSDGKRIAFVNISGNGDRSVWLATLDGRTAPHRLSTMDSSRVFFGADGQALFLGQTSGDYFLYRIGEDGTGLQRVCDTQGRIW